jgi:hypothetical protein
MKRKSLKASKTVSIKEAEELDLPDQSETDELHGAATEVPVFPAAMPIRIFQAYKKRKFRLLREAKERVESVLLDMTAWNVLWQVDGRRTVEEIAMNLTLTVEEVIYHIECLRLMRIICPVDAVYLPDFIQEKTAKNHRNQNRRRTDEDAG